MKGLNRHAGATEMPKQSMFSTIFFYFNIPFAVYLKIVDRCRGADCWKTNPPKAIHSIDVHIIVMPPLFIYFHHFTRTRLSQLSKQPFDF